MCVPVKSLLAFYKKQWMLLVVLLASITPLANALTASPNISTDGRATLSWNTSACSSYNLQCNATFTGTFTPPTGQPSQSISSVTVSARTGNTILDNLKTGTYTYSMKICGLWSGPMTEAEKCKASEQASFQVFVDAYPYVDSSAINNEFSSLAVGFPTAPTAVNGVVKAYYDGVYAVRLEWAVPGSYAEITVKNTNLNTSVIVPSGTFPTRQQGFGSTSNLTYAPVITASGSAVVDLSSLGQPGIYSFSVKSCAPYSSSGTYVAPNCAVAISTVNINVAPELSALNLPPTVSFVSPQSSSVTLVNGTVNVPVSVTATDIAPANFMNSAKTVANVKFYAVQAPNLVAVNNAFATVTSATNSVYSATFRPTTPGDYYLIAVAEDTAGAMSQVIRAIKVLPAAAPTVIPPNNTVRVDFNRYATYSGEFNDDGYSDVYFHGLPLVILLHGSVITPITLEAPEGFIYYGAANGRFSQSESFDADESFLTTCKANGTCKLIPSTQRKMGDSNGDGHEDLLLINEDLNGTSLLISGTQGTAHPQALLEITGQGYTGVPGKALSVAPVFTNNLSGQTVAFTGTGLQIAGTNYLVADLQKAAPLGESVAINESIAAAPAPILPSPTLSPAEQSEIDSFNSLGGEFRVNEMGAATYSIPLALPAGTAGVAPSVSLEYNSQNSDGIMGLGWGLNAGGAISRCRQTLNTDGIAKPITYTTEDRLCLDGQRLLAISGSYWSVGSVYKTEIDNGSIVKLVSANRFEVYAKDGSKSVYSQISAGYKPGTGATAGTWVEETTKPNSWSLTEFADSVGNKITYIYEKQADYFRLKTIQYAYGDSTTPAVEVTFNYGVRASAQPGWQNGLRFFDNSRLNNIVIKDAEKEVGNYVLNYNGSATTQANLDKLDRISSIKYCVGQSCAKPAEFTWGYSSALPDVNGIPSQSRTSKASNIYDDAQSGIISASGYPVNHSTNDVYSSHIEIDINGDGLPDLLTMSNYDEKKRFTFHYSLQKSDGSFYPKKDLKTMLGNSNTYDGRETPRLLPLDYNADGRMDIAIYSPAELKWFTFVSAPNTYSNNPLDWQYIDQAGMFPAGVPDNAQVIDMNSDGLGDLVYSKNNNYYIHHLEKRPNELASSAQYYRFQPTVTPVAAPANFDTYNFGGVLDLDEDGKVEMTGLQLGFNEIDGTWNKSGNYDYRLKTCDWTLNAAVVNANATAPLVIPLEVGSQQSNEWRMQRYNGSYFYKSVIAECNKHTLRRRLVGPMYVDINTDGIADVVWGFTVPRYKEQGHINNNWDANNTSQKASEPYFNPRYYLNEIKYRLGKADKTFAPAATYSLSGFMSSNLNSKPSGFSLADINLDGKLDLSLVVLPTDVSAWSNNSSTTVVVLNESTGSDVKFSTTRAVNRYDDGTQSRQYSDINGDGALDYLTVADSRYLTVQLGKPLTNNFINEFKTGLGAATKVQYEPLRDSGRYTGGIPVFPSIQTFSHRQCPPCSPQSNDIGSYCSQETANQCWDVYITKSDPRGFYESINEPFAEVADKTYLNTSVKSPVLELANAMPVITRVASSAPLENNPSAMAVVDYYYGGLKVQAGGRGMLGFETLRTVDAQTGVTTSTTYRQDWPFIGSPVRTETKASNGQLLKVSENQVAAYAFGMPATGSNGAGTTYNKVSGPSSGMVTSGSLGVTVEAMPIVSLGSAQTRANTGTASLGPLLLFTLESKDMTYNAPESALIMKSPSGALIEAKLSTVITTTEIDKWNNVLKMEVRTLDGSDTELQSQITQNVYFPGEDYTALTAGTRLGRIKTATVQTLRNGQSVTRTASFAYDGYESSCGGFTGLLCSEKITVTDLTNSQAPELTQYYYDGFGNKTHSKTGTRVSPYSQYDALGRYVQAGYDVFSNSAFASSASAPNYSAPTGTKVVKVSEVLHRSPQGTPIITRSYTGNNWVDQIVAVTPMGTPYFKGDSTGNFSQTLMKRVGTGTTSYQCPIGTAYVSQTLQAGGAQTNQCFDKIGRDIGSYAYSLRGKAVRQHKKYDVLGRVIAASEPTFAGAPMLYTLSDYDILGRPIKITHPFKVTNTDGAEQANLATTTIAYAGLSTTTTTSGVVGRVPNGSGDRIKVEVKNALGELVSITEQGSRSITYGYDVLGNLTSTKDPLQNITKIIYNGLGQKIRLEDLDKGTWSYTYNEYGELVTQTDANRQVTTLVYDQKGRKTRSFTTATTTGVKATEQTWEYDNAENALGQLNKEQEVQQGFTRIYQFDALGRAIGTSTTLLGHKGARETFYQKQTYDQFGRAYQSFDSARVGPQFGYNGVVNEYNDKGFLVRVKDAAAAGKVFYTVENTDARGNVTEIRYGDGNKVTHYFNSSTGYLETISRTNPFGFNGAGSSGSTGEIVSVSFRAKWDHLGNMASRSDALYGTNIETFKYDEHNRLVSNKVGSGQEVTVKYDEIDNITSKKNELGVTTAYTYHSSKKHAVEFVGTRKFEYDGNGNVIKDIKDGTKTFKYSGKDQVVEIAKDATNSTSFSYGSDDQRYKRVDKVGTAETTTLYLGSVEVVAYNDGTRTWKRNVGGYVQIDHIQTTPTSALHAGVRSYFYKDHLGSISAITDANGKVKDILAFDPWGARRKVDRSTYALNVNRTGVWTNSAMLATSAIAEYGKANKNAVTQRGFTGHEMVDEAGIIHMNGRIYDASIGRFLQADPIIQEPTAVGSLNRYSYTMNNPLNAVDPTGYSWISKAWKKLRPFIGVIIGAVVAIYCQVCGASIINASLTGAAIGAASTALNGGNLRDVIRSGILGGISGAAFFQAGDLFRAGGALKGLSGAAKGFAQIGVHGAVGGVMSVLQGGKFGNGFVSAGIAKGFTVGGAAWGVGDVGNFVLTTLAGGTASVATGGKFASGAQSAALAFIVNHLATKGAEAAKNSKVFYQQGKNKIDTVYNFAKITNPDLDFGDKYDVLDLGLDAKGKVISGQVKVAPWGKSNIKIDDSYLAPLDMDGMVDLLDTFIHEAIHRNDSFIDNTMREPIRHPQVAREAGARVKLLRESFEGHIRSVYQ